MTKVYTLKSGKTYTAPSLFVNPQHILDVKALWYTDDNYGLPHIDGIYLRLLNYKKIFPSLALNAQSLIPSDRPTLREKIIIIDPALDFLLSGMSKDKETMLQTGFFDNKIKRAIKKIINSEVTNTEKTKIIINDVYPYLQSRRLIEFQVRNGADVIVPPCINLSSSRYLTEQILKARQMLIDARTLLETSSLKKYLETRDLMNIVTINANLIKERNFHVIFDLLLCNKPDHIGIKILGLRESDSISLELVFRFLRELHEYSKIVTNNNPPPLHLVNVDELGYVGYCSGVCNIISPIATTPYFAFSSRKNREGLDEERDTSPTYYHPLNMNYPKLKSIKKLPCSCKVCNKFENVSSIPNSFKTIFRRIHWLLTKDGEIQQFRETDVRLDIALRDKLANSMRTQLVAYLPSSPVFTI